MEKIRHAEKERRLLLLGPSVSYHLNFEEDFLTVVIYPSLFYK